MRQWSGVEGEEHVVLRGISRQLPVNVKVAGIRFDDVSGPAASAKSRGR